MNKRKKKDCVYRTSIGGQAVIEGVMMRGPDRTCVAVRGLDGEIQIEDMPDKSRNGFYKKIPVVRGVVNFITSMILGFKAINRSAEISLTEEENEAEKTKFDKYLERKLGDKAQGVIMGITFVVAMLFAVGLFFVLPFYFARAVEWIFRIELGFWFNVVEGVSRLLIFILYIVLIRKIKDIRRLFCYHGAEHKTIHCYEHGEELTRDNIRKYSCLHKRCGTNFLVIVMVISILVFSFLSFDNQLVRIAMRLLLLPLVAGLSYEVIKLVGRYDNLFTDIIAAPGLLLQKLTTGEPDDGQIDVAVASLTAVLPQTSGEDKW